MLLPYEMEDIARRACVEPPEWKNPFGTMRLDELILSRKNLRLVIKELNLAICYGEAAERDMNRYLD